MTRETAEKVLDFFVHPERAEKEFTVWFFGGEPAMEWDTIEFVVSRAKELAAERGINVSFGITTNGSLLDDAKISFMNRENFGLIIS